MNLPLGPPDPAEMERPGSAARNRHEDGAGPVVSLARDVLLSCRSLRPPAEGRRRSATRPAAHPPPRCAAMHPPTPPSLQAPAAPSPLVLVSCAKGEARSLRAGYKALARHLKAARCEVRRLDRAPLTPAALDGAAIVVFGAPTQPFAPEELEELRSYLRSGGNLLVLAAEGGADAGAGSAGSDGVPAAGAASSTTGRTSSAATFASSNLGALLEEFGLGVGADCIIQTAFTK